MYSNVDNGVLNKREELSIRISQTKPNIIGLTEIKPKHQSFDAGNVEFELSDYHPFFNENQKRGVALYIDKSLNAEKVPSLNDNPFEESVWLSLIHI